ncbi:hypothetical protein A9Q84_15145 [Halobacteriovorax marinus]|uniref:Peptidase S1 domain-containing protein n=1 Tax=Halobacteriovorax marinus TaxID=97084 RepID=A0A1Y5FB24_9BACT|nr:hypothetical protein A9Q84_15145 [Halobacteriovorax marinus]
MKAIVYTLITVQFLITSALGACEKNDTKITFAPEAKIQENLKVAGFLATNYSSNVDGVVYNTDKSIAPNDMRVRKNSDSPKFLDAVGRMGITKENGKKFVCSGILVGKTRIEDSRIVISSEHCGYGAKGRTSEWKTTTKSGKTIKRKVQKVLFTDPSVDYAILLLDKKVSHLDVEPLVMGDKDSSVNDIAQEHVGKSFVAGYSADKELGKNGDVLTYSSGYQVIDILDGIVDEDENGLDVGTMQGFGVATAFTYGGASGGAVIVLADTENGKGEQPYLVGMVRGSVTGDSHTSSNGVGGSKDTKFVIYKKMYEYTYEEMDKYNK